MKGGNGIRLRGIHISLPLIALGFATILLYAWEKIPFVTEDQITLPASGFLLDAPRDTSAATESKVDTEENEINQFTRTDINSLQENNAAAYVNATIKSSSETENSNGLGASSSVAEEIVESPSEPVEPKENMPLATTKETKKEEDSHTAAPVNVPTKLPSEKEDEDGHIKSSSVTKAVCNYAKGRWVADRGRPLYSGHRCKQWLSGMWACRLTQRIDFSYEGYRWQPYDCEMPDFERSAFLRRMQNKTIAFVGDSLGRQQFQSLMCMATGGDDSPEVQDVGWEYGLVKGRGAIRPDGWAYRFLKTNTTILYYWSASLCDLEPINVGDPATEVAMHLDRPPAFLKRFFPRFDVLILNTGHHWNRGKLRGNRWVMYVNGRALQDRKLAEIGNAKNLTIYSIVRWVDSQLSSHPGKKAFFRTISPRHFSNGDWNTGGSCDNTTPLSRGAEVLQDGSSDMVVESAVRGTKVKILDITALSQLRDEGHISHYSIKANQGINDCLHWCLPGIPDTWNELLCAQI